MKLLADTHALLWAIDSPERLSSRARNALISPRNSISFSTVSLWEIAIKMSVGRLALEADWRDLGTRVEAHGRLNRRTTARLDASRHERRYEWLVGPMKDLLAGVGWIATPTMRIGTAAD